MDSGNKYWCSQTFIFNNLKNNIMKTGFFSSKEQNLKFPTQVSYKPYSSED